MSKNNNQGGQIIKSAQDVANYMDWKADIITEKQFPELMSKTIEFSSEKQRQHDSSEHDERE